VNQLNPLVLRGEFKVTVTNSVIEVEILRFKSSFIFRPRMVAGTSSSETDFRLDIEQKCHIRAVWRANKVSQFLNEVQRNAAAIALVRHRRMVIAVADHHFFSLECRLYLLLNILTP